MIRSTKTTPDELDNILVELQNRGKKIAQIFACPESVDLEGKENKANSNIKTAIVVVYSEEE